MGKVTGFMEFARRGPEVRPVAVRLRDWREVYQVQSEHDVAQQASRCMDCGIPFCTQGCPLGNRIPVFNDRVYSKQWTEAAEQLLATNNFPEFTGRLCPAPCESACVLAINDEPVTIERIEYQVAEHAFATNYPVSRSTSRESARRVAIVGSGPAGLAAAAQLRSVGHAVEVFERSDALGGLLRYGIPEFKLEKSVLDRRLRVMAQDGISFHVGVNVGLSGVSLTELQSDHDAVLLAVGSTRPRLVLVAGYDLEGVHYAMTYLEAANRAVSLGTRPAVHASGRHVVILGGGDTGADCLGTVHRQGAASVTQIEIMEQPPDVRPADQPWPTMARVFKTTPAHAEGGERRFSSETLEFCGASRVQSLVLRDHVTQRTVTMPVDLVLIAAGFVGPELDGLGLNEERHLSPRSTLLVDQHWRLSNSLGHVPVFACGDAVRGQSLIVWAIAEGRSAAAAVDAHLRSGVSSLPAPVTPYANSW